MLRDLLLFFKAVIFSPVYMVRELAEDMVMIVRYFPNKRFRRAEVRLFFAYLVRNPYVICQRYLDKYSSDDVQKIYGETFFSTLRQIAQAVNLSENDVIYDLGCGRGRSVFWFNAFYNCRAVGVEINPVFVEIAQRVQEKIGTTGVEFKLANILDLDYINATVIYLYGSAFSDGALQKLSHCLRNLKRGTRIVTVSYPLTDYSDTPLFEVEQKLSARFCWGNTHIYVQRKL